MKIKSVEVSTEQHGVLKHYDNPTPEQVAECRQLHEQLLEQRYYAYLTYSNDPEIRGNREDSE